jgi:hypothetical protein
MGDPFVVSAVIPIEVPDSLFAREAVVAPV